MHDERSEGQFLLGLPKGYRFTTVFWWQLVRRDPQLHVASDLLLASQNANLFERHGVHPLLHNTVETKKLEKQGFQLVHSICNLKTESHVLPDQLEPRRDVDDKNKASTFRVVQVG